MTPSLSVLQRSAFIETDVLAYQYLQSHFHSHAKLGLMCHSQELRMCCYAQTKANYLN